jgi:hypothetical protein
MISRDQGGKKDCQKGKIRGKLGEMNLIKPFSENPVQNSVKEELLSLQSHILQP